MKNLGLRDVLGLSPEVFMAQNFVPGPCRLAVVGLPLLRALCLILGVAQVRLPGHAHEENLSQDRN